MDNSAVATGLEKVSFHSSPCQTLVTLWMVACQSIMSMGILQARILEWVARPSSGDLPNPGIKSRSPELQADSLPTELHGKSFPIPQKGNAKECSNYCTTALISHASTVMFKILQARLQQYENFQMFKLDLEKAEKPEIKLSISVGSWKKQESSRKTYTSASLTILKPLTV